jgi:aldehyde:ferredoxin oxidoreductase
MYGYNGKIARTNLSTRQFTTEPSNETDAKKFLGGKESKANVIYRGALKWSH